MNLLIRQIWALIRKNLLIICLRRPITTFIRALAIPMAVVLVLAYTKDFFATPLTYGISSPHAVGRLKRRVFEPVLIKVDAFTGRWLGFRCQS